MHRSCYIVFLSLIIDLIAFAVILPLMPSILDHYKHHDEVRWSTSVLTKLSTIELMIYFPMFSFRVELSNGVLAEFRLFNSCSKLLPTWTMFCLEVFSAPGFVCSNFFAVLFWELLQITLVESLVFSCPMPVWLLLTLCGLFPGARSFCFSHRAHWAAFVKPTSA